MSLVLQRSVTRAFFFGMRTVCWLSGINTLKRTLPNKSARKTIFSHRELWDPFFNNPDRAPAALSHYSRSVVKAPAGAGPVLSLFSGYCTQQKPGDIEDVEAHFQTKQT